MKYIWKIITFLFLNLIIHEVVRVYNKISVNVKHDVNKSVNLSYLNEIGESKRFINIFVLLEM